jgi:endonuclease
MPIYAKPVRLLMRDMANAFALKAGQTFTKREAIEWFAKNYPKIKAGTIAAHLIRLSTNAQSRLHYNAIAGEDDLFFQIDGSHFRLFDSGQDPYPIHSAEGAVQESVLLDDEGEPNDATEFAYEKDLKNYLAKNLSKIEPGLKLYEDDEGITGIEFPVGGRFIDILAVSATGDLVVVELKVSRGYDRVIGQLMRYMAWIRKKQADPGQRVRGVIVAREISEDLLLACSLLQGVQLFEYEMSVALNPIAI